MRPPIEGRTLAVRRAVALVVAAVAAFVPSRAAAQTLSIGSARTEAERAALRVAVEYAEQVGDIFLVAAPRAIAGGSFRIVDLGPSVVVATGDEDTFNSVIAKITGNVIFGAITTTASGALTPCATCFFHVVTVSGGFESDRGFDNTAFLAEIGYVPWFQNRLAGQYAILASSSLALFVQGGYKADTAGASGEDALSGAADRSAEDSRSSVLRLRADYRLAPLPLLPIGDNQVQMLARASGWRDLANGEWYHRVEAGLRITLAENQSFDLLYEEGAGAPTFNEGEQFSANLTIAF